MILSLGITVNESDIGWVFLCAGSTSKSSSTEQSNFVLDFRKHTESTP